MYLQNIILMYLLKCNLHKLLVRARVRAFKAILLKGEKKRDFEKGENMDKLFMCCTLQIKILNPNFLSTPKLEEFRRMSKSALDVRSPATPFLV